MGQPTKQPASQPTQPDSGLQFVPTHTTLPGLHQINQPINQAKPDSDRQWLAKRVTFLFISAIKPGLGKSLWFVEPKYQSVGMDAIHWFSGRKPHNIIQGDRSETYVASRRCQAASRGETCRSSELASQAWRDTCWSPGRGKSPQTTKNKGQGQTCF
jgi:hypothetical protein